MTVASRAWATVIASPVGRSEGTAFGMEGADSREPKPPPGEAIQRGDGLVITIGTNQWRGKRLQAYSLVKKICLSSGIVFNGFLYSQRLFGVV
jgi:hypothetical protein